MSVPVKNSYDGTMRGCRRTEINSGCLSYADLRRKETGSRCFRFATALPCSECRKSSLHIEKRRQTLQAA